MPPSLTLRDLNRATAHRQLLTERADAPVAGVVGQLAGLQAQHATWPYVALWSRRATGTVDELETAIADRSVVRATVMRTTLHLVHGADFHTYDAMTAAARLATWRPSASRAGLDLLALNHEVRTFCRQPRTVAEIEAHLAALHPNVDPGDHVPSGVRNVWFRLASSGGGLVHSPPSGFWAEHGKPRYLAAEVWLGTAAGAVPTADEALRGGIERFLAAYGPATLADLGQWSGQRRIGVLRAAVQALGERIVEHTGPGEETYLDLAGHDAAPADADTPPRFLARWDSLLIAYATAGRRRIVAPEHVGAVYKKNGDVLSTFLVDGMVAGLWTYESTRGAATLRIEPFGSLPAAVRHALTDEAHRLICYVAPEADRHDVVWA